MDIPQVISQGADLVVTFLY